MKNIQKLVLVPIEKWEKIRNKRTCERSFSENSSSEGSSISEESYFSSEESTRPRNVEKNDDSSEISSIISDKELKRVRIIQTVEKK